MIWAQANCKHPLQVRAYENGWWIYWSGNREVGPLSIRWALLKARILAGRYREPAIGIYTDDASIVAEHRVEQTLDFTNLSVEEIPLAPIFD